MRGANILPVHGEVAAASAADGGGSPPADRSWPTPSTTGASAGGPPPRAGEDFGSQAARLAGFCAVVLGWTPDQFWRATPAEVRGVVGVLAPQGDAPVTRALLDELEKSCG